MMNALMMVGSDIPTKRGERTRDFWLRCSLPILVCALIIVVCCLEVTNVMVTISADSGPKTKERLKPAHHAKVKNESSFSRLKDNNSLSNNDEFFAPEQSSLRKEPVRTTFIEQQRQQHEESHEMINNSYNEDKEYVVPE
jgi:hypothetical protein